MILAKLRQRYHLVTLLGLLGCGLWLAPIPGDAKLFSSQPRHYGPTDPSEYTVRVMPQSITINHSQRQLIQVIVETIDGTPINGVEVQFRPSEGHVTSPTPTTQNGVVTGTFATATGSDQPRTAYVVVTVENVNVTVFIDIVPAVFSR